MAAIRAHIEVPELDTPLEEAASSCTAHGGSLGAKRASDDAIDCEAGGVLVFACAARERLVTRCTHYEEGATLSEEVQHASATWGTPDSSSNVDQHPSFVWSGGEVVVTAYDRGVKVTRARLACQREHGVCVSGPAHVEIGAKCKPYDGARDADAHESVTASGMSGRIDMAVTTLGTSCDASPVVAVTRNAKRIEVRFEPKPEHPEGVWSFHLDIEPLPPGSYAVRIDDGHATRDLAPVRAQ